MYSDISRDVGVVVNYFTNFKSDPERLVLVDTTRLSLRLLALSPVVGQIVLVDGSKKIDPEMRRVCVELGVDYVHSGRCLSYSEAYNVGWPLLDTPFIALMANDIIPHPVTAMTKLREAMLDRQVGCSFPYFSSNRRGGDEIQRLAFGARGNITCEPSTMTLNLNLFRKEVLEQIGGVDERFSAGYAEPILISAIRRCGYLVQLIGGAKVIHYDQLTKNLGQSDIGTAALAADTKLWFQEFPELANSRGLACINLSNGVFSKTFFLRSLWWISMRLKPLRLRMSAQRAILYFEPALTRTKGKK